MKRQWMSIAAVLSVISIAGAPVVYADSPFARSTGEVKGMESGACSSVAPMAGGPDGFGYSFLDQADPGGPSAVFTDISLTGTALTFAQNDDATAVVTLGAPFTYYGIPYGSLTMSTNGYLSTDPTDDGSDLSNDCPLPASPSSGGGGRIYPLHDDLVITGGYYQFFGTCPQAPLGVTSEACSVFMWSDATRWGQADSFDINAILYHSSGEIRFAYRDLALVDGSESTTGIQDSTASSGLPYACNTAASITDGTAVSFLLPDPGQQGDLAVTISASPSLALAGQNVILSIEVSNGGPLAQGAVTVQTRLPSSMVYRRDTCGGSAVDGLWTWNAGTLANSQSASCDLVATAENCLAGISTASVTGSAFDLIRSNNSASAAVNMGLPNAAADPGFEGGTPNADWTEFSTNFGSPLCTVALCGNGAGTVGPRTGDWWGWLGGAGSIESGSLEQTITIPGQNRMTLNFHLWNGSSSGTGNDFFRALLDGTEVFSTFENNPAYTGGYTTVTADLSPWADGGNHLLRFEGEQTTAAISNFSLDDIWVGSCPNYDHTIFTDGFESGDTSSWSRVSGRWKVNASNKLVSNVKKVDKILADDSGVAAASLDPTVNPFYGGRLIADIKLTRKARRKPNAAIIFAFQDPVNFRYVRVRRGKVIIGQVGSVGAESAGPKGVQPFAFGIGQWHALTVDVMTDGTVNAYVDGQLAATYAFPDVVSGGAGFWAKKAKSIFDNFTAFEESVFY